MRSSQGGGRARLTKCRQVLIVKEPTGGGGLGLGLGVSDYRSGSECYRVNGGSRRAVMAANWAACWIAKIGKGKHKEGRD